jgi:superfamily II DNA or RNA helicase
MRAFLVPSTRRRPGSRVGATYSLPADALDLEEETRRLTLQARCTFGAPPPPFCAYHLDDDRRLHMPRFYGLERFGEAEVDERVDGEPIALAFGGTLTPVQREAKRCAFERGYERSGGCIVSLPCGYGKTVASIETIATLGRKACVLVHKAVLRDQWAASLERFCPGVRVGFVQGDTWDVEDKDVVVAMVLTVAKRDFAADAFDGFGTVVCDEAHHMAAPVMNTALRRFRARYVIGLTATKERPDGLTPLLHWSLGPEGFRIERDGSEAVRVSVAVFDGPERDTLTRDGKPLDAVTLTKLAKNPARNAFIARRVVAMRRAGRVVVVLSDRNAQLDALEALLLKEFPREEVGKFVGATKERDRPVQLARPIVLSNYPMANEGLDKVELDTCVMATPKGRVTQCIGRVQRPCATKQPPLVLDVADGHALEAMRWRRQAYYRKMGYETQVVAVDGRGGVERGGDDAWFA